MILVKIYVIFNKLMLKSNLSNKNVVCDCGNIYVFYIFYIRN